MSIDIVKFGSDDDAPFDDTKCARCETKFGLGLDEVSRSVMKDLCTDCFELAQKEAAEYAHEQDLIDMAMEEA